MLAFGLEAIAPFEFYTGSPRVGQPRIAAPNAMYMENCSRLHQLEETRGLAALSLSIEQQRRKAFFGTIDIFVIDNSRRVTMCFFMKLSF